MSPSDPDFEISDSEDYAGISTRPAVAIEQLDIDPAVPSSFAVSRSSWSMDVRAPSSFDMKPGPRLRIEYTDSDEDLFSVEEAANPNDEDQVDHPMQVVRLLPCVKKKTA